VKLISLKVLNFRNLDKLNIEIKKNINILHGGNGQGKTSILEAIYLLGITKSFRVNDDRSLVKNKEKFYDITGDFLKETNKKFRIRIFFSWDEGKHVFYNQEKIKTFSSIIGTVPIILLSLEDLELTYGSPSSRRKFMDILLSQIDPVYLQSLKQYKKVLLNRNKVLVLINEGKEDVNGLIPWDQQLIEFGSYLCFKRYQMIKELNPLIEAYYRQISEVSEKMEIGYQSSFKLNSETAEEVNQQFKKKLQEVQARDINYGSTTVGPHRDDLIFYKNNQPLKVFGSQGENKTFLISLKFAEAQLMEKHLNIKPILLLDDIFGELDQRRIKKVVENIQKTDRQTFITTTKADKFKDSQTNIALIKVENGQVIYET